MLRKKFLAALALLLIAAMVSTATLAYAPQAGKKSENAAQQTGNAKGKQQPKENASKGNKPDKQSKPDQENPEQNGQGNGQSGKDTSKANSSNGQNKSLDLSEIEASIAALTDTAAQATLNNLMQAYKAALANEESGQTNGADKDTLKAYRKAAEAAKNALVAALDDAGISTDKNEPKGSNKELHGPKNLDLAAVKAKIAALTDEAVKASLTALMQAYETALANEQAGLSSGADEATMAAYRKLVEEAKAAVLKALTGANINAPGAPATPSSLPKGQQKKQLDIGGIEASIATVTDATAKANLAALVESYKTALANEEIARKADDGTLKASREAAEAAETALLDALDSAGLDTAATSSSIQRPQEQRVTGIWVAVVNWFSNLFGKLFK